MKAKLTINSETKKTNDIKNCGDIIIHCDQCQQNIIIFQITKDNKAIVQGGKQPIFTNIKIRCHCGSSIIQKVGGLFFIGAANDDVIFDLDQEEDYTIVRVQQKCQH